MISDRVNQAKENYVNARPSISYQRALFWTESHRETEGEAVAIRRARAFKKTCEKLVVSIFDDELIVGASGEFRKCGILTSEFSWTWVDREMDNFDKRIQDPYEMTDQQCSFVRKEIFPYWQGKSLEEAFLAQLPEETAKLVVDTGFIDNDSKWRQSVGEITPDFEDVLFKKGFQGIIADAKEQLTHLNRTSFQEGKPQRSLSF